MKMDSLILAFYLPQFHPIPENDQWWEKGFTEWTNATKARKRFRGHRQPNLPADLGFYDLRVPETRIAQAELAKNYGINGFIYWHYWFGNGKRLLERPFEEVVSSGEPDFPFCLAWANESWTGRWHGLCEEVLVPQQYPGKEDAIIHFRNMEKAFHDPRYIRVDQKPLFFIYKPELIPDGKGFISTWNELAIQSGLNGIFFIGITRRLPWDAGRDGYNGKTVHQPGHYYELFALKRLAEFQASIRHKILRERPFILDYRRMTGTYDFNLIDDPTFIPTIIPNWDNTPRSGNRGWVFNNSSPVLYQAHLIKALRYASSKKSPYNMVLIKSWNEWAEGNYLEPDMHWGREYLEATMEAKKQVSASGIVT